MIFFPYSWHLETESENIKIWIFGLTEKNKSICVIINDFKPYIYVELPTSIQWTSTKAKMVANKIDFLCGKKVRSDGIILTGFSPYKKELIYKKKLYHASLTNQTFPFLKLTFTSSEAIRKFTWKIKRKINVTGLGTLQLKSHEHNANPILQLISSLDIPTAGWIEFSARKVKERETYCRYEYIVKSKSLKSYKSNLIPQPLILSMDIEVNSSNPSAMPDAEKPGDKVFQISCVLFRNGSNNYQKFLLTLGEPNPDKVGKDVEIIMYNNEADLLIGYSEFILEKGPQLIIGYNILGFDIPYMITRSKYQRIIYDFDQQGFVKHQHASEKLIKWSSSAYKNQEFQYLDAYGRLFVDLLPLIKRDYKLNRYNLKTVSTHFLGETKDPLTPKGIFKCYRLGFGKGGIWNGTKRAIRALAIVGKYCVQDSLLVAKLFNLLQTWVGLTEMAKTCNVPIFYLYTQGQQIKVFAQVYKKCLEENIVVEYDGYQVKDDEYYTGAHVFDPVPGMYDKVVPFDFSSLYPTTIIAYNIDYSTLAMDPAIPDEVCHVIEWEDHIGCEHDTTKRTTKPPHIMCTSRRYRFLKKPMGIIPALLTNLLNARANTKKQMKEIKAQLSKSKKPELQILLTTLDKRQASYKVSANSMYGAMGVRRGFLPFLPGAMCTTAMGRKSLEKAAHILQEQFKGKLVYGDTDSCYIQFPHLETAKEIWDYSVKVEDDISNLFPRPMRLAFEEKIYWKFFILTKKRYMALWCLQDGVISDQIFKRGVLIARRDNSKFIREIYKEVVMKVLYSKPQKEVVEHIITGFNQLCSSYFNYEDFIVTKSIGEVSNYKIRELLPDEKKRLKRMKDLKIYCYDEAEYLKYKTFMKWLEEDPSGQIYRLKCLPAHVQLAEKMRTRGVRVDVGTRLEYLVTTNGGPKARQYEKIEDPAYQQRYSNLIKIDYLYYLHLLINPLDQVLKVRYGMEDFVKMQYKLRMQKYKFQEEIKNYFSPTITFL